MVPGNVRSSEIMRSQIIGFCVSFVSLFKFHSFTIELYVLSGTSCDRWPPHYSLCRSVNSATQLGQILMDLGKL